MTKLEWFTGSNGNKFADAQNARYCCAFRPATPHDRINFWYEVAINGYPIGRAESLEDAKAIAQAHHDRP